MSLRRNSTGLPGEPKNGREIQPIWAPTMRLPASQAMNVCVAVLWEEAYFLREFKRAECETMPAYAIMQTCVRSVMLWKDVASGLSSCGPWSAIPMVMGLRAPSMSAQMAKAVNRNWMLWRNEMPEPNAMASMALMMAFNARVAMTMSGNLILA